MRALWLRLDAEESKPDSPDLCESVVSKQVLGEATTIPEAWGRLTTFPNYAVSNMGEVFKIGDDLPMPWWWDERGYRRIAMWHDGLTKPRQTTIHKLVAEVFLPPQPTPKHTINHLDGVKDNNWAFNLEWATSQEQADHAVAHGLWERNRLIGEKNGQAKLNAEQVREIRRLCGQMTQKEIAKRFGVHQTLIALIHTRKKWAHID